MQTSDDILRRRYQPHCGTTTNALDCTVAANYSQFNLPQCTEEMSPIVHCYETVPSVVNCFVVNVFITTSHYPEVIWCVKDDGRDRGLSRHRWSHGRHEAKLAACSMYTVHHKVNIKLDLIALFRSVKVRFPCSYTIDNWLVLVPVYSSLMALAFHHKHCTKWCATTAPALPLNCLIKLEIKYCSTPLPSI